MILDEFPSVEEFYKTYWNQKPFVVRAAIDAAVFDNLIDGDSLAALSLEEDVKSRVVVSAPEGGKWTCDHGPFDENHFSTLGETHWSLLVQNVEQYHTDTAQLLQHFNFAPRWLMDDVMVSYSEIGGSVGPHTDSYHVFLVQGQGRRQWTIGTQAMHDEDCIEGLDLKVLKTGVQGETVEVSMSDVIYLPPHFAHEGVTIEESLTFSVGFLGPRLSDLMIEYGYYLASNEETDERYSGQGLDAKSAAFTIAPETKNKIQDNLIDGIRSNDFAAWLATYFSTPTYDDVENIEGREEVLSADELIERLNSGDCLHRPDYIKLSITKADGGMFNLSAYGAIYKLSSKHEKFIHWLNDGHRIKAENVDALGGIGLLSDILTLLYNQNIIFFEGAD
jgi:50S ribosomal protein L16 3-hydroxylase